MKTRFRRLLENLYALYLTSRDDRTPPSARLLGLAALAWVVFPGDFDFVPLLGWIDDAVVVTAATWAVDRIVPEDVRREHDAASATGLRGFLVAVAAVVGILALVLGYVAWRAL